jgi:hypothetical protein
MSARPISTSRCARNAREAARGRIYTVVYEVVDAVGLETTATTFIKVPHDQGGR